MYTDIIKMVTAIKQLTRGGTSTAGIIVVLVGCLDQRNSVTHQLLLYYCKQQHHSLLHFHRYSNCATLQAQVLAQQSCVLTVTFIGIIALHKIAHRCVTSAASQMRIQFAFPFENDKSYDMAASYVSPEVAAYGVLVMYDAFM